jgi:hypothetical protein
LEDSSLLASYYQRLFIPVLEKFAPLSRESFLRKLPDQVVTFPQSGGRELSKISPSKFCNFCPTDQIKLPHLSILLFTVNSAATKALSLDFVAVTSKDISSVIFLANSFLLTVIKVASAHGVINYIDTIAKCPHLKKFTCQRPSPVL